MSVKPALLNQTVIPFVPPHAELRKSYQAGQNWQMRPVGFPFWFDYSATFPGKAPLWSEHFEYRLKPAADLPPVRTPVSAFKAMRIQRSVVLA